MHKEDNQRPFVWVAIQMRTAMQLCGTYQNRKKGKQKEAYRGVTSLHKAVEGWHTGFKVDTSKENASI